jgi:cyclic pyranopterin monophosphate synthase
MQSNPYEALVPDSGRIDVNMVGCRDLLAWGTWFCYLLFAMTQLSHVDEHGRVRMVDTGNKEITLRRAVASARVLMTSQTVTALREHRTPKGDPLEAARLAGIMAAKRTSDLIPLCHPLPLTHVDVQATLEDTGVALQAEVSTNAQTGVEMEALTAVSIAALTVYDMCKALEKGITITDVRLESKIGGKSGDYSRV